MASLTKQRITPASLLPAAACLPLTYSAIAHAHERFIKHDLRHAVDKAFFGRNPDAFLGINPNMTLVGLHVAVIVAAFLVIWFLRNRIEQFVERRLFGFLKGKPQRMLHMLGCFVVDRPVKGRIFHAISEWAVIFFMRSPGLVLMYSASNDSLVMPSYPLDPASANAFKFLQVGVAILILTQTLLPLCGAIVVGLWIYLIRWGWMVSIDAAPVLTVAIVYMASPWLSHKVAITDINKQQMRMLRLVLGGGFFALGWLKVYNYNLVAGVGDNYPSVMNDPLMKLLAVGTDPAYARESWIVAFGMAEIMSGFLLMMGVFTRVWAAIMFFMFTKLMLVDFGWEEIPHIYPLGAMLVVITSSKHSCEFEKIEELSDRLARQGRTALQMLSIAGPAIAVSLLLIFPILFALTFIDRSTL